jgi:hypothetical protein
MRGLFLLLCLPAVLPGQVVRGVVRDSASSQPAAGVLVTLIQRTSGERRTVLTDADGRYTIGAPGAGVYALETKRIGVRAALSAEFSLGPGEAREMPLAVAPVIVVLETVRVSGRSYCGQRVSQNAETATLWEEVRAALTATRLTSEARRFPVTITSFTRVLHPLTFEVRSEDRREQSGVTSNPFMSAPLASLSAQGYIVTDRDGLQYRGPDVDVLLSDEFVRDHCFRAVIGTSGQVGLIGLAFEPTTARRVPDIAGILWIDAKTRQLRRLEYRYTRHPLEYEGRLPLSYIDYTRTPTGAWVIQRWAIRMPQVARVGPTNAATNAMVAADSPRLRLIAVIEEGGEATIGVQQSRVSHAIEGTVFDSSANRALGGARVFLRGTPFNATADASGRFRIQLPDTGTYLLTFEHPRLDSLAFDVPARPVRVAGAVATADIAVPPLGVVRAALCPSSRGGDGTGIVHGLLRKPDGTPMSWATIKYRWSQYLPAPANAQSPLAGASSVPVAASPPGASFVSDSRGRYLICDVPAGRYRLTLESESGDVGETEITVDAGELVLRDVGLRRR